MPIVKLVDKKTLFWCKIGVLLYFIGPKEMQMDTETLKKRTGKLSRLVKKSGADAIVLTVGENVSFVTGFTGDDSWALVCRSKVTLITDSRYTEQASKQCPNCKVIERTEGFAKTLARVVAKSSSIKKIALEDTCSVRLFAAVKKNVKVKLIASSGLVESVRRQKDPKEVRHIAKAARIAYKALDNALPKLHVGITENQWAGIVDLEIRKQNSTIAFDTIVAFGPNASRPHHQPGRRKLKKNDCLLIDFGVKHKGYCSDITRCFAVGLPGEFYRKAYNVVLNAQQQAIKAVKAGADIPTLDAVAKKVITDAGLPVYGHGTGHGLGLEVHEAPGVSAAVKDKLKVGDVITIEPGVYIPGKLGIRIEDDVLVTRTGCKILTKDTKYGFSAPGLQQLVI